MQSCLFQGGRWCSAFLLFSLLYIYKWRQEQCHFLLSSSLCEKKCAKLCTNPFWLIGGFGTYLFGMSETIAKQATEADNPQNVKNPHIGWMIGFLFLASFIGLFALVPLRKVNISTVSAPNTLVASLYSMYQLIINWNHRYRLWLLTTSLHILAAQQLLISSMVSTRQRVPSLQSKLSRCCFPCCF